MRRLVMGLYMLMVPWVHFAQVGDKQSCRGSHICRFLECPEVEQETARFMTL